MGKQHLGIIGLGVMGKNLALNAESKGFPVAGFDVDASKRAQVAEAVRGKKIVVSNSLQDFTQALETPRRIWMMVPAGKPVDAVLHDINPHLSPDDILIDGGNSYFKDTERRAKDLEAVLTKMAAQTEDGACCTYLGPGGAGHYVKMVHNGIEYGIMQTLCEAYDIMKNLAGLSGPEVRDVFAEWNAADLNSFLMEITIVVLGKLDPETKKPLVDLVLDTAEQKGTGKWTAQDAMDLGVAVPTLTASVLARIISGAKADRVAASKILIGPSAKFSGDRKSFLANLRQAYKITAVACYAQGFEQLRVASNEYHYGLNLAETARIWKGGCIIRAKLLDPIRVAFQSQPGLKNLLLAQEFSRLINENSGCLREAVKMCAEVGVPCPAFSNSLTYIDSYRQARLPANLLQAQRDYFGAHTYRRIDKEGVFHTEWDK